MDLELDDGFAVHPERWLRGQIDQSAELSVTALADRLRVTRQAASNPLNGNAGSSNSR